MAVNKNIKDFIVYIIFLSRNSKIIIHQAFKTRIIFVNFYKIFNNILANYLDILDIFLKELVIEIPK